MKRKSDGKFSRRAENGKSTSMAADLSFGLAAAAPGKMMFVGGSKSREGRRGEWEEGRLEEWRGRKGDQDQESAKFARFSHRPWACGASLSSLPNAPVPFPAVAVSRIVDVAF